MNTRFSVFGKRVAALAGTVALAAAAVLGGAAAANAATPGNIDFTKTGSITVHKHTEPAANTPNDGTAVDLPEANKPLEGVEFKIEKTTINLQDPKAWDGLAAKTPGNVQIDSSFAAQTKATTADGSIAFTGLPLGVYLVTEMNAPADLGVVSKAAPFLVVLPMNTDADEWNYDVHAYPKNSVAQVEKTINAEQDAKTFGQGDIVTWDVDSLVPMAPKTGENTYETINKVSYSDQLDARLAFQSVTEVMYNGVALDPADYAVTPTAAGTGGETVVVTLTASGLAKVQGANGGKQLTFKINTKVVGDIGDGVITNTVKQITNIGTGNTDTETPSEESKDYWGSFSILKVDQDTDTKVLEGAEFQVFATSEDAAAGNNPISINGQNTFTTAADGTVIIGGLNLNADGTARTYYFKETKAPAGYVLDETVREVNVTAGNTTVAPLEVTVTNDEQDGPNLPLTGATGTMLFIGGGLALVALAVGVAMRNQRRARA